MPKKQTTEIDRRSLLRGALATGTLFGLDALFTAERTNAAAVGPNDKIKVTKVETFVLRNSWVFVKVSCHGAEDRSREVLLGKSGDAMYDDLEREYRDHPEFRLHYVTAREMYNIAKAAEVGKKGDPANFLDYAIPPYQTHQASGGMR